MSDCNLRNTSLTEQESLRTVSPLNFCASAIPPRIEKLKEERTKLITKLYALNAELSALETIDLLNKSNGY